MEILILDNTIVRAYPCATGALKKGGQAKQALGQAVAVSVRKSMLV